ncbi:GmrSD restriction endonuclease domain-containing protein, partial [Campylobacter coli]
RKIAKEFNLNENEEDRLDLLHQKIFDKNLINFYLEEEQDPDKAVNIFIRINSNGEPLDYSDILFSIAIANWNKIDARTEINNLVDKI